MRSLLVYLDNAIDVAILEQDEALAAFAALLQEHRLRIVRLLVEAGPEGVPAGLPADRIGAGSSKVSFHLAHLEQSGLVRSHRNGRQIIYAVRIENMSTLIGYLMKECCGGRPEYYAPAFAALESCSGKKAANV